MGMEHFAAQLEYYYQKPRPEKLALIISRLNESGALNRADNRLMIAAFLSELSRAGKLDLQNFASFRDKNMRHTLLWSAKLAGDKVYDRLSTRILATKDAALKRQLEVTPSSLKKWPLEPSVTRMYISAFMANGDPKWIEELIDAAFHPDDAISRSARALLYDSASRHPIIRRTLEQRSKKGSEEEKEILDLILNGAQK